MPSKALVDSSELLVKNFKMPFWRFTNSGTEATLDAIRMSRARSARSYIIKGVSFSNVICTDRKLLTLYLLCSVHYFKVESGYHGHHDAVWVSIHAGLRSDGDIPSTPFCSGIPKEVSDLTLVAEFNNIDSIKAYITKYPDQIACVIVEPVQLNCSMIKPINGYLQSVIEVCKPLGIAVIFDIVKLNTAVSYENISQFWDASCGPDMVSKISVSYRRILKVI